MSPRSVSRASKLFRCVIMGPPGSGKGTVAERILNHFPLAHISCGDQIRTQVRRQTSIGKEAHQFMQDGRLVPSTLISKIMAQEIGRHDQDNLLLDGFPRTVDQAKFLQELSRIDAVIELDVPYDVIVDRLTDRWIHPGSGRIYNLQFNPPKVPGIDDVTGEPLVQREDDKPETVKARLDNFDRSERPVSEYFRDIGRLEKFKGRETNQIWPQVYDYLTTKLEPERPFAEY